MHIDWQPDNRPEAAFRIAEHTQRVIESMNRAATKAEVKVLFDDWMRFARDNRVCRQICEHMIDKRRVLVGEFDKPKREAKPTTISETSKRMTGERE